MFPSIQPAGINGDTRIDSNNSVRVMEVIEGESVVLPCELTKMIGYDVEWSHNGRLHYFIFLSTQRKFQLIDSIKYISVNCYGMKA